MKKNLEQRLRKFLESEFRLNKEGDEYTQEVYVDHDDQLSDKAIKEILESDAPMVTFYDQFEPDFSDSEFDYLHGKIENEFEGYNENQDEIDEWLREHVHFYIPEDHYLNRTVCANLILDTGDGNYDFTLNNLLNGEDINKESALLWLAKKQGYTKKQLKSAMSGDCGESKLLKSIRAECANVTTHMNALAFFVKTTIRTLIDYKENPQTIKLNKGTSCGLIDVWNGAGGILEIELEKDIKIPPDKVRSFKIDGADGYGVDQIYGMSSSFWTE